MGITGHAYHVQNLNKMVQKIHGHKCISKNPESWGLEKDKVYFDIGTHKYKNRQHYKKIYFGKKLRLFPESIFKDFVIELKLPEFDEDKCQKLHDIWYKNIGAIGEEKEAGNKAWEEMHKLQDEYMKEHPELKLKVGDKVRFKYGKFSSRYPNRVFKISIIKDIWFPYQEVKLKNLKGRFNTYDLEVVKEQ